MVMKSVKFLASGAALVLMAACSGSNDADADGDGKISVAEAADAAASSMIKPDPGLYRATITMTAMEIPGIPSDMAGLGNSMTNTEEYCLTPEEVEKGYEEMMKQGQDGECSYERFNLAGGKIDAMMTCNTESGKMQVEMKGNAGRTSSDFDAKVAMDIEGVGKGSMRFTAKHERIGDCKS
jgi:hypothetical protein